MNAPMKPLPIPLSSKRTDVFTPPSLKPQPKIVDGPDGPYPSATETVGGEKEIGFVIRIPTPSERDMIGTRLFELGLTSVTQETIRATMVDELYKIDWAADAPDPEEAGTPDRAAYNEAAADERAEFLDGYWQRQSVDELATERWMEQEAERVRDEGAGADPKEPTPQPVKTIKVREHARAKLLIDDMMERSVRLRMLAARQMDYGRQNAQMMVRLHVLALQWDSDGGKRQLPESVKLERDETGLVTTESVDSIREWIGTRAWDELVNRIDNHYSLSEEERKNSDLPLAKLSDQTGSHEQSGGSELNDGSSTDSSTGPVQTDGSGTITGKSSGSRSGNGGGRRKSGRTGGG